MEFVRLHPDDMDQLAATVVESLIAKGLVVKAPGAGNPLPLPGKLTIAQFAWCIERSIYYVQEQARSNSKFRAHVQGRRAKKINPQALALFGVDPLLASERLKTFTAR